mmetsp:Transcript_42497/g.95970  ORF Transcript_42497/g.95970 Transcript_42497/m.95970 type:complete len:201 (+) Transcript_42497:616-1218(+)
MSTSDPHELLQGCIALGQQALAGCLGCIELGCDPAHLYPGLIVHEFHAVALGLHFKPCAALRRELALQGCSIPGSSGSSRLSIKPQLPLRCGLRLGGRQPLREHGLFGLEVCLAVFGLLPQSSGGHFSRAFQFLRLIGFTTPVQLPNSSTQLGQLTIDISESAHKFTVPPLPVLNLRLPLPQQVADLCDLTVPPHELGLD